MSKIFLLTVTGVGSASALPPTLSALSWGDRYKVEDFGGLIISKSDRKFENYCYYAVPSITVDRLLEKFGAEKNGQIKGYSFIFSADKGTKYGVLGAPNNKKTTNEKCSVGSEGKGYGSSEDWAKLTGFLMGIKSESLKKSKGIIVRNKDINQVESNSEATERNKRTKSNGGETVSWCFPYALKGSGWQDVVEKKYGIGGFYLKQHGCFWPGWSKSGIEFSKEFNEIQWKDLIGIWLKES